MFVERLVAWLSSPQSRLGELDDLLVVDVDHYRALLMREARVMSEAGRIPREVASWAFTCIADGWVDEHLHHVRDCLIEVGAVSEQQHLDRLLGACVLRILGQKAELPPSDLLLIETMTKEQPCTGDGEPLGLRLHARRYALEIGLLSRLGGITQRTPLGDTARRLPRHSLPGYLLALELLQSTGTSDRWRAPRRALSFLLQHPEFRVPLGREGRRYLDPEGVLPWKRVRRLCLLGVCEEICASEPIFGEREKAGADEGDEDLCCARYRLLPSGEETVRMVLREPPSEIFRLAEAVLEEQTRLALRPLLSRTQRSDALRALPRPQPVPARSAGAVMRPAVAVPSVQRVPQREIDPMGGPSPKGGGGPSPAPSRAGDEGLADAPAPCEGDDAHAPGARLAEEEGRQGGVAQMSVKHSARREAEPDPGAEPAGVPPILTREPARDASARPEKGAASHATPVDPLGPGEPQAELAPPALRELEITGLLGRAWAEICVRDVEFQVHGEKALIMSDRRAILQAFREVLRSAADAAMLSGEAARVTVEIVPYDDEVVVLVHDSGPALSPKERESVLDTCLGTFGEGPRSGLLRAHRILLQHGAAMTLPVTQMGGTTVRIACPKWPARESARRAAA